MDQRISETSCNDISRRTFVKGAAMGAVALAGASALAEAASTPSTALASESATSSDDVWALEEVGEPESTISADVCIIGGGGTGMAAAIEATEAGLSAVLLEKNSVLGGAFIATEGMFGVGSHWQEEAGEHGTVEEAVTRCLNYHHYIPSPLLYKNFFSQTAETIDWLESHGCTFRAVVDYGGNLAWHVYYYDKDATSPGAYFTASLEKATEDCGCQIMLSTPAKQILTGDNGVTGVLAVDADGKTVEIDAPVVLIATGGYASNMDFLHAVSPYTVNENLNYLGTPGHDGDGIKMAKAIGASLAEGYGTVMWCGPCAIGCAWASDAYSASVQPTLWVNGNGDRYINEDLWIGNFAAGGVAARNQKLTYVIFTEADLTSWEKNGPYGTVFTFGTPGVAMADARAQLGELDSVHKADTIAELAEAAGLDADKLQATVDRYNELCKNGEDTDFGKAADYLFPVEEGPFYILEVADGFYTTVGGVKINPKLEAVDDEGNVISGLYVGGCDAGGLYGDSYDVACAPGSQASWAINSGRLSMKNAVEYLGK